MVAASLDNFLENLVFIFAIKGTVWFNTATSAGKRRELLPPLLLSGRIIPTVLDYTYRPS